MVFTAEATNTGGEIFATEKINASSVHYPLSKIVWGADSNAQTMTDTGDPFPVRLYGHSSANPVFVGNNSAHVVFVRDENSTTVTVTNPSDSTVTIAALSTASKVQTEPVTSSANPTFVNNNSATVLFVRDENSTTVTVTNIAGNDTVVTVTNPTDTTVTVSNPTDTTVTITGPVKVIEDPASSAAGGYSVFTGTVSSAATAVASSGARLYGYHIGNPDTAGNVFLKVYDDTGGPTLGTDSADMDLFIPFGGGAVAANMGAGITFSSGIVLAAAGGAGSTDHSTPSTSLVVTMWFANS